MHKKYVLFDLDGTLLPMDQDKFIDFYFGRLTRYLAPHGYEPRALMIAMYTGMVAMIKNDGSRTNCDVFWRQFSAAIGKDASGDVVLFDGFYEKEFDEVRDSCGCNPDALKTVRFLQNAGITSALATNPLFPRIATEKRIGWAGLSPSDFALVTTYEDYHYCKSNPKYFTEVLDRLNAKPAECIMVGNDADEDGAAAKLGIDFFLLTDCLINHSNADLDKLPHGGFAELNAYLARTIGE